MSDADAAALGAGAKDIEVVDGSGRVVGYFATFVSKEFRDRTQQAAARMDTMDADTMWSELRRLQAEGSNR